MEPDIYFVLPWSAIALAAGVTLAAGFVKGAVGFAMPMIMVSGLGSFMPPEIAIASLIVPALLSNLWQALRQGTKAAANSVRAHWRYLAMLLGFIALSAQLVTLLSATSLYLILGLPVTVFALLQLAGWAPRITPRNRRAAEIGGGAIAGAVGGISGVYGPPTVLYLTALDTAKTEQVRVQGVIYGAGAVMLALAHLHSGILTAGSAGLSLLLSVPALIGMATGLAVQDRLDQARFRKLTLVVLVAAGLNLVRRGLTG